MIIDYINVDLSYAYPWQDCYFEVQSLSIPKRSLPDFPFFIQNSKRHQDQYKNHVLYIQQRTNKWLKLTNGLSKSINCMDDPLPIFSSSKFE
jgi:hypothetical protein